MSKQLFSDYFSGVNIAHIKQALSAVSDTQVRAALTKPQIDFSDFPVLISKQAAPYLEQMAQRSRQLTQQRFGHTMKLFIPLYLSNACYNNCSYCGFSYNQAYKRTILSVEAVKKEAALLSEKGFEHVLLLTGEDPKQAGVPYLIECVKAIKPYFASIGLEVQPLKTDEYQQLIEAGVDNLSVYQETYHQDSYLIHHLSGKKRNFKHRLDTMDRAGEAGFHRVNLGALLGLYEWRFEALALAQHLRYLKRYYWGLKYGLSVPRIQKMLGQFSVPYKISDFDLIQFICAFRLVFPDLHITLSTRESALFRDRVLPIAITDMSAESCTSPGGYSGAESEAQFELSDKRSLKQIQGMLKDKGYDPLLKDWDTVIV